MHDVYVAMCAAERMEEWRGWVGGWRWTVGGVVNTAGNAEEAVK